MLLSPSILTADLLELKESIKTLVDDKESIFIFPEDISNGYFDEVTWIHSGYYLLGERCFKKNVDLPIYLMYLNNYDYNKHCLF